MTHTMRGHFKSASRAIWGGCLVLAILVITPLRAAEPYRVPPTFYPQVLTIAQHVEQSRRLSLSDAERQQLYLFILARFSAVGLAMMTVLDTDVQLVQTSEYLRMKGRNYWMALTVRAVRVARAIGGDTEPKDGFEARVEQARMFIKIYRRSLLFEARHLNRGLLVNDALSCVGLIGVERTVS